MFSHYRHMIVNRDKLCYSIIIYVDNMLQQNLTNVVLDWYLVVNCFTKCVLRMLEMPLHRPS